LRATVKLALCLLLEGGKNARYRSGRIESRGSEFRRDETLRSAIDEDASTLDGYLGIEASAESL